MASSRRIVGQSVNARILDLQIRRALYVHRYGSQLVNETVAFLNEHVFPDILGRLLARLERIKLRGYDSGFDTTKNYVRLLGDVTSLTKQGTQEARKALSVALRELAKLESASARQSLLDAVPLEVDFGGVNLQAVQAVVSQPINGRRLEEWFDGLSRDLQRRISEQIGIGMATGETTDQMVRRIRGTRANGFEDGVLATTRRQAEMIVRTSVNHVSAQAREQTYAANSNVIKGVQWVSTLDTRTSDICKGLDGKVFPLDDGPRPPAHPNCRSTTVPVLKSWQEIGIKAKEAPASTRASMNGQVPDSLTYGDWLRNQPAAVQDEALGKGKARLFREGRIEVRELVGVTGKPLTLEQLRRS